DAPAAATRRRRLVLANGHLSQTAFEDLDGVALGEGDDRALLVGALPLGVSAALDLAAPVQRVDRRDGHVPDDLHRLLDLGLVRARIDQERVRVVLYPRVRLLGDDRPDDHVAGQFHCAPPAAPSSTPMAASVNRTRSARRISYVPRLFAYVMRTCRRLRNDFSTTSCGSG